MTDLLVTNPLSDNKIVTKPTPIKGNGEKVNRRKMMGLPDKPTPSMCEAGIIAMSGFESGMGQIIITGQPKEIYEAMVKRFYEDNRK